MAGNDDCSLSSLYYDLQGRSLPQIQLLEEIVALVVDDYESRKILDLDAPDRLHAELGIFDDLDLLDAVLGEVGGRTADRAEIEAAVLLAGLAHRGGAIALGEHHHRAARRLELVDIGIHAARRGRPERARRIALRRLRRARVIDRVVLEIVRQGFAALESFAQLGVREIARDDHRPGELEPGADRMPGEVLEDLRHRTRKIDVDGRAAELLLVDLRQVLRRILLERLEKDALARDLS